MCIYQGKRCHSDNTVETMVETMVVKTMSYSNPAELRKRLAGLLISAPN